MEEEAATGEELGALKPLGLGIGLGTLPLTLTLTLPLPRPPLPLLKLLLASPAATAAPAADADTALRERVEQAHVRVRDIFFIRRPLNVQAHARGGPAPPLVDLLEQARSSRDLPEICPRYARDMPEISHRRSKRCCASRSPTCTPLAEAPACRGIAEI